MSDYLAIYIGIVAALILLISLSLLPMKKVFNDLDEKKAKEGQYKERQQPDHCVAQEFTAGQPSVPKLGKHIQRGVDVGESPVRFPQPRPDAPMRSL